MSLNAMKANGANLLLVISPNIMMMNNWNLETLTITTITEWHLACRK